jgi:hypothetical protein
MYDARPRGDVVGPPEPLEFDLLDVLDAFY